MPTERGALAGRLGDPFRPALVAPLLLAAAAALSWAYADRSLPPPDEGAYLTAASKILDGLVYYRDIDAYPFPGASYLLAFAMSIFGEHLAVARGLAGAVFCVVVLGSYASALAVLDRPRAALGGAALLALKFLAFPIFTMYFYADLAMAACVVALAVFLRHDPGGASWRLPIAGLFVGLAIVSKQNAGLYLGAAMVGVLAAPGLVGGRRAPAGDRLGEVAALGAGIALPVAAMSLYFARHGLLGAMLSSGLLRPLTSYLPTSGVSFLPPLRWWELGSWDAVTGLPYVPLLLFELLSAHALPGARAWSLAGEVFARVVYASLPAAVVACAWLRWRAHASAVVPEEAVRRRRARFFTLAILSFAIAASAFPRADLHHVLPVFPVLWIVWLAVGGDAAGLSRRGPRAPRWLAAGVTLGLVVVAALALRHDALLTHHLVLERADLRVRPQDAWVAAVVRGVRAEVPPGEPLFVYGHEAQLYFLSDRYSPWPFSQLYPGMAGRDGGATLARRLEAWRPRLVLRGLHYWPGMTPVPSYTPELAAALERSHRDDTRAFFERWSEGEEPPPDFVFAVLRPRDRLGR